MVAADPDCAVCCGHDDDGLRLMSLYMGLNAIAGFVRGRVLAS
jgi:hypothetical protein